MVLIALVSYYLYSNHKKLIAYALFPKISTIVESDLLKETQTSGAIFLMIGANAKLKEGKIDDSAFLYFTSLLRKEIDKELFPPTAKGSKNPLVMLGGMSFGLRYAIAPEIISRPEQLRRVIASLYVWEPDVGTGYTPDWEFKKRGDTEKALLKFKKNKSLLIGNLRKRDKLLSDTGYFEALQTIQEYHYGSANDRPSRLKAIFAFATMIELEKDKKIFWISGHAI